VTETVQVGGASAEELELTVRGSSQAENSSSLVERLVCGGTETECLTFLPPRCMTIARICRIAGRGRGLYFLYLCYRRVQSDISYLISLKT
jgi:hypothetical protein